MTPYLFFAGRCREALDFYCKALGAEVEMVMTYAESPDPLPPGRIPAGFEDKVMHASLKVQGQPMMCSDGCDEQTRFQGFRLMLTFAAEEGARAAFAALAEGGTVDMPLSKTFYSPCYGMLIDRFGVGWMVMVPGSPP